MKKLRIVYMGTPEFAVATLGSLLMNGFNVVAVVTAPDKPAGRGRMISKSAVKEFAKRSKLPVIQPVNLKDQGFTDELKSLRADLFIVVAFRMLPESIWKMPALGTINLHASLLPDYRGAAPINHVIINGETKTGITTFFIDDKIDTGNILLREEIQIFPFENAGDLHDRLMKHGARLVIRTIESLKNGTLKPLDQADLIPPGAIPRKAPKLFPEDCIINWKKSQTEIHNLIRGLAPYPGARSFLRNNKETLSFKILESQAEIRDHKQAPGHMSSDGKSYLKIACNGGFVNILVIQLEGKKRMTIVEFLRGFKITDYSVPVNLPA